MRIEDLKFIAVKFNKILEDGFLVNKYQQLIDIINSRRPFQEMQEHIKEIKDFNLKNDFSDIYYYSQKNLVNKIGINDLFGKTANNRLDKIIRNYDTAAEEINQIIQSINNINNQLKNIVDSLQNLKFNFESKEDNRFEMVFDGEQSIDTIKDLQSNTKDLPKHIVSLSRLSGKVIEEPKIISISKNTPTIIQLAIENAHVLVVLNLIIKAVLKRIMEVQEIEKNRLEIKNKKLLNRKIQEGFDDEVAKINKDFEKKLANELYQKHKPKETAGAKNEVINATKSAIIYINNFIDNGGVVNVCLIENNEGGEASKDDIVLNQYEKILLQKREIKKLIPPKKKAKRVSKKVKK